MRFNRHVSKKKEKKKRRRDTRSMKNDRPRDHYDGIDALLFIPCNFTSNSLLHFSLKGTFPLMNNLWFDETLGSTIFASSGKFPEESKRQYKMFYHIYIFIYIYISSRDSLLFFLYHDWAWKDTEAKIVRQVFLDQCQTFSRVTRFLSITRIHIPYIYPYIRRIFNFISSLLA